MSDTRAKSLLVCSSCSRSFSVDMPMWRCTCGGLLDIVFDAPLNKTHFLADAPGLWRYRAALPLNDDNNIVTFSEGGTPLLPHTIDGTQVMLKLDHLFPTGSFKDRGASVLISKARELRIARVVEDSSGNAGATIAAYCARAGIGCDIYVPAATSSVKLKQIESTGAHLQKISGSREDTAHAALNAATTTYYASHSWNPFFLHGVKTCAFEIAEQLQWQAPEAVVVPVGNGTLLLGLFIGFSELLRAGIIDALPKMIAVQSSNCSPLADAFEKNLLSPEPVEKSATLAEGIAVAQPVRGAQILKAVRQSRGAFVKVNEQEIAAALAELHKSGFYVEPTSATAVAGFKKWHKTEPQNSRAVIVLTGHGFKTTIK
jgi:threonine synthase